MFVLIKNDAAVLLVDHPRAGLLSLVRDIEPDKFKNNVLALGDWLSISTYQLFLPPVLKPVLTVH